MHSRGICALLLLLVKKLTAEQIRIGEKGWVAKGAGIGDDGPWDHLFLA